MPHAGSKLPRLQIASLPPPDCRRSAATPPPHCQSAGSAGREGDHHNCNCNRCIQVLQRRCCSPLAGNHGSLFTIGREGERETLVVVDPLLRLPLLSIREGETGRQPRPRLASHHWKRRSRAS
nr:hypothetical protein Itr_chr03CG09060 [Ipomoea trifida]